MGYLPSSVPTPSIAFVPSLSTSSRRRSRDRLLAADKTKMQVIGAVPHKLIRVIYGVLHSNQSFDPTKLCPTP